MKFEHVISALTLACVVTTAHAQGWTPQKNVEIVATSVPGGSQDKTARALERIFLAHKLVPATLTVLNKSGGGAISRSPTCHSAPATRTIWSSAAPGS